MSTHKLIVCLANSRKLSGRCIAGKEWVQGKAGAWIRPVSARPHEEVSEHERQYEDGSDPKVLDIVAVPLLEARPKGAQSENWLLDPDYYWTKTGEAAWPDLAKLVDPVGPLWLDGIHTYSGLNDEIPQASASAIGSSLRFLYVKQLMIHVFKPGAAFGNPKRRVQGRFRHGKNDYWLWVTDPVYERTFLLRPDGEYELGDCYLTVSIGEPYEKTNACYKLIAAIFEHNGGVRA